MKSKWIKYDQELLLNLDNVFSFRINQNEGKQWIIHAKDQTGEDHVLLVSEKKEEMEEVFKKLSRFINQETKESILYLKPYDAKN